ncbi:MAG: PilZ domain-containing protein [Myxococcota bacterium]
MASSVRVLEAEVEVESNATPVTELPLCDPYAGQNRRFVPRVSGRFTARGPDGDEFVGLDLSFGGMLCLSDEPVWPGNELEFKLSLEGKSMAAVGRVVELVSYRGEIAMRVRFTDVNRATRRAIAAWMASAASPCISST